MSHLRQRGISMVMFVASLPALLGFAALAVDVGHIYLVRSQLQNGADAAALAGAGRLDGTVAQLATARLMAYQFAAEHSANGTPIALHLNLANEPSGDIALGHWHAEAAPPWFEALSDPASVVTAINAVQVRTHRTAASGGAVQSWLAQFIGRSFTEVSARAIAVGGGPSNVCAFPIAIPDCVVRPKGGAPVCGAFNVRLRNDSSDNAGFTNMSPQPPVSIPILQQLIDDAHHGVCHSLSVGGDISLQNGNGLHPAGLPISSWIAENGGPVTVYLPILQTRGGGCNVRFNQAMPVAGFAKVKLVKVYPPGGPQGNTLDIIYECNQSEVLPAGGGFFGVQGTQIYLAQ